MSYTKGTAAIRLGIAINCSWDEALAAFATKQYVLYAQCVMPPTKEDEEWLANAIQPDYQALRCLFPIEVQREPALQELAKKSNEKTQPESAPIKKEYIPKAPNVIRQYSSTKIAGKIVLFIVALVIGMCALFVSAYWKYQLLNNFINVLMSPAVFFPLFCVITIEASKIFLIFVKEFSKAGHIKVGIAWSTVAKWLHFAVFLLSALGATALIGYYSVDADMATSENDPALAALSVIDTLTQTTGCSRLTAILVIGFLLAAIVDLCIYMLLSSAAFEAANMVNVRVPVASSISQTGEHASTTGKTISSLPKIGISLSLIGLAIVGLGSLYMCQRPKFPGTVLRENSLGIVPTAVQRDTPVVVKQKLTYYISIDGLTLRKQPGIEGSAIKKLRLNESIIYLGEQTAWTEALEVDTEKVTAHWLKIRTATGTEGWVFGAGVTSK